MLAKIAEHFPQVAGKTLEELHAWQAERHAAWAVSFNEWRERQGFDGPGVDIGWPLPLAMQPAAEAVAAAAV